MTRRRLPRRPLTSLGVSLTRVGLAIEAASPPPDSSVVHACIDGGVSWIDTTATQMDTLIDGPLAVSRRRLVVCVTVGRAAAPSGNGRRALRPAVESWVQRVPRTVSVVPVLEAGAAEDTGSWASLHELIREGIVPAAALSDPSLETLHRCRDAADVNLVRIQLSFTNRAAAAEVLPECLNNDIDVLARSDMSERAGDRLTDALTTLELRHGNARSTAGLAWALAWPGVRAASAPIVSVDTVPELLDAAQLKLTSADLDAIAAALTDDQVGVGPVRPGVHA